MFLSWDFPKGLETYLAQEYIQITSKRDFSAFFTSHFCAICFPCRITGSPVLHSAVCFILLYYIAISLQGRSSLWGGLLSELRLCYLLKQQADAAMSQGSFLPALLLLGNCPNQAGLLTHLQQSSILVPKS